MQRLPRSGFFFWLFLILLNCLIILNWCVFFFFQNHLYLWPYATSWLYFNWFWLSMLSINEMKLCIELLSSTPKSTPKRLDSVLTDTIKMAVLWYWILSSHFSRCGFSMMAKWAMLVYFKLMMVKCSLMMVMCLLMMVKCSSMMVKWLYDRKLISPSLTST